MEPLDRLDRNDILSETVLAEVFDMEDIIEKERALIELKIRAKELGIGTDFNRLVTAYRKVEREMEKKNGDGRSLMNNWTNFDGEYDNMYCGSWIATETGIYAQTDGVMDTVACYHPIIPVERLKNLETGEEQIKIAYKRNGKWTEIIVQKDVISSASKIVALSKLGISVTSENAKYLVRYMSDLENWNEQNIKVQHSTSKLGWLSDGFIPYDKDIIFDGDGRFKQVFESICQSGDEDVWMSHVRALRRSDRIETKFMFAASFASVLVKPLGGLPFFVDLWGETEAGKTVILMLACSVWANPNESRYIGDFKTTDVALEARADLLNNLPMILDDTSKTSGRVRDNFEGVIYDLCSGKGKSRSNRDLGMNRENRWSNVIITNGERPLNSYVNQGGAINRILEIECGEKIFDDPVLTAETVKRHYGFAGRKFIEILKKIGFDEVKKIQKEIMKSLKNIEKMEKQSISLSIVLTADKIITEHLFNDGRYISLEDAKELLIDRNELSDNERCYQYIMGEVSVNSNKFNVNSDMGEIWGLFEKPYVIIINNVLEKICKNGGFSKKSFLSWAKKNDLLLCESGRKDKLKKINGYPSRCVYIRMPGEEIQENLDFMHISEQMEIPFNGQA